MPVLTAAQKKAQFEHVIKVLLGKPSLDTPLVRALAHHHGSGQVHQDVDCILALLQSDIDTLEYEHQETDPLDSTKTITKISPLPKGDRNLVHTVISFHTWKAHKGQDILPDQWDKVTHDDFRHFRINEHWKLSLW